jgi:hypothetical protein
MLVIMLLIGLGGRSNHAFRFSVGFLFLKLVLFRFGGRRHRFAMFFAFDGVVNRSRGFIGSGKTSFLCFALGFFFASLGDVFGQYRGFFRAHLRGSVFLICNFGGSNFRLVVLNRFGLLLSLLMRRRGSCGFDVLLGGSVAMLPLRKRLAGQRFEAGRKGSRSFGARFGMKIVPWFERARRRRFVRWFRLFDDRSYSRRACGEIRRLVGSGDSRRVVR